MLLLSFLIYAGGAAVLFGAGGLIRPVRRLGLPSRTRALGVASIGAAAVAVACLWPTPTLRSSGSAGIDMAMPAYQFVEHHDTAVHASPSQVFAALRQVTAGEIQFFQLLTWIRNPRFGTRQESVLAAPNDKPILDVALAGGFRLIGERPPSEIVLEVRVAPRVRGVMNFQIAPDGHGGSLVSTETRVLAADARSLRAFTVYWRLIYPGSSIIRVQWLRAIKRRAELQLPGT